MKLVDFEDVSKSTVHFDLEIRAENFRNFLSETIFDTKQVKHTHCKEKLIILLEVFVYPQGTDAGSDGWLVVCPALKASNEKLRALDFGVVTILLSVIDVNGNSKLIRSFEHLHTDEQFHRIKYLERTIILSRGDELLLNGVLTIRCEFYLDFNKVDFSLQNRQISDADLWKFLNPIPQTYWCREGFDAVFDFTSQILTLPRFHDLRKRFGVYGIPPTTPSINSESRVDTQSILNHVWIFDTKNVRFLLNLDENQESVSLRLLKASPTIQRNVNDTIIQQREKRIHLPNISGRTFIGVLYFLENGKLIFSKPEDLSNIENMSSLYEMKDMRKICSDEMQNSDKHSNKLTGKNEISDLYSEEYLSNVWDSRRHDYELLMLFLFSKPHVYCTTTKAQIENQNVFIADLSYTFTVYDFTSQVLSLPQFHESRKRFGVYGITPTSSSTGSDRNENDLEHVWIFDTCPDRFLLSLKESQDSIGVRLLKMSSVLRLCVNAPAKEQTEKRIDFSPLSSWTFTNVLYFLETGILTCSEFREFLDIYKMAHLYEMKELRTICAEEIVKSLVYRTEFEEVERVIDLYSDKNLKELLYLRRSEYKFPKKCSSPIMQACCTDAASQPEDSNSTIPPKVYDFTTQVLTLPQFHETRKRFGVYGIPPPTSSSGSDILEDNLEKVWTLDTFPDRFLLFVHYDSLENTWNQLLDYSPVLYQLVDDVCRKKLEKKILFSNISSRTFKNTLYFLEKGIFSTSDFRDILDIYKMSYLFGMGWLQDKCAKEMVRCCKSTLEFEATRRLVDIYLDKKLRVLLDYHEKYIESPIVPQVTIDDRSDFQCYI